MHSKYSNSEISIIQKIREVREKGNIENSIMYAVPSGLENWSSMDEKSFKFGSQAIELEEYINSTDEKNYFNFAVEGYGRESVYNEFSLFSECVVKIGFHVEPCKGQREYVEVVYTDEIKKCKNEFTRFLISKYQKLFEKHNQIDAESLDNEKIELYLSIEQIETLQKITYSLSKSTTSKLEKIILSAVGRHMKKLIKEYSVEYQMSIESETSTPNMLISLDPLFFHHLLKKLEYFRFVSIMESKDEKLEKIYKLLERAGASKDHLIDYFVNYKIYSDGIKDYINKKSVELMKLDLEKCIDLKKTLIYMRLACKNPENMVIFVDDSIGEVSFAQSTKEQRSISLFKSYKATGGQAQISDLYKRKEHLVISISKGLAKKVNISVGPDIRFYKNYLENQDEFFFYLVDATSNCLEYEKVRFKMNKSQKQTLIDYLKEEVSDKSGKEPEESYKLPYDHIVYILSFLINESSVKESTYKEIIDYVEKRYDIGRTDFSDRELVREIYDYMSERYYVEINDGIVNYSILN